MCGISGILHLKNNPVDLGVLQKINRCLTHRGPDDEGYYVKGPIGLGHRRLSIIDLSGGHQPITSDDGRYTIVFNGEIYNYQEIKKDLESSGFGFITNSDTEALLKLYIRDGVKCLAKLNGMFAFAIWDELEKRLFLARDRMGKKPLYYWRTPNALVFASEPKAILSHPQFIKKLNKRALKYFFQYEYVPSPLSIYQDVFKLPQAHYLMVSGLHVTLEKYWDVPLTNEKTGESETEMGSHLVRLLDAATQRRLMSDVPLGVFLSGGLDSSAVVALMSRHRAGQDIKTFSIGFEEASYDESSHAALIARTFNTEHHHTVLSAQKMLEILPTVVGFLDEPFADYSILPTYLLSQFARESVTVALGGDGSDELFAGYPTFGASFHAETFQRLPVFVQKTLEWLTQKLPVSHEDMSFDFKAKQFLYGARFPQVIRNQVWLGAFHQQEMADLFVQDENPGDDPLNLVKESLKNCVSKDVGDQLLYFYQKFYLCDDILVKTDRASMAHSLEVRAPFLDVNVVEYAASIPFASKLKKGQTKAVLKTALEQILPHEIIDRPKKGFGIPLAIWLRSELKNKMLETLSPERIKRDGIFKFQKIETLISQHLSGEKNNRKQLFSLLMFHWWQECWL